MIGMGEDELICDFAETYHILDIYALPIELTATLACGLREDARILRKIYNTKDFDRQLRVGIYDCLNWLKWSKTKAAEEGGEPPESLYNKLYTKKEKEIKGFEDTQDFDKAWKEMVNNGNNIS